MYLPKKLKNVYTLGYYLQYDKHIPKNAKKMKAKQNRKIHELMKIAYEIPFYRKRFEMSGTTPDDYHCSEDLEKFPLITKADLRLWMQEETDAHPEMIGKWDVISTSGSSGTPLRVLQTQKEVAAGNANWIRILQISGYNPFFGKMYSFETSHRDPKAKKEDSIIQRFGILRRKVVDEKSCVGEGVRDTINEINEYKPDMLCFRRNCLVRIALYAKQHNMPLWKPRYYVPVSEMVDDVTVKLLHEMMGPGLIDGYGASETGCCVVKYPGRKYYHIMNDTHVVNIYDENNHLAENGKVILTTLFKKTFPIINYDVGDLAESKVKDGVRYISRIQGRVNDLVKHEDGVESSALELMKIANGTVGLAQFRFIEKDYHHMHVQLVADPNNQSKTQEENENYFKESVRALYGDEFEVTTEWLEVLPPDQTNKQRCFVCKVASST